MPPLSAFISTVRSRKGLTQKELSKLTGISQANISNIEKGKQDITVSTLRRIACALDIKMKDFFEEESGGKAAAPLTRNRVEKIARSAAGHPVRLSGPEKQLALLFRSVMPSKSARGLRIKKVNEAWMELKRRLSPAEIRTLIERVREHETNTN